MITPRRPARTNLPATRPELLAPAGTEEAFWAAIEHGADAVYVGLKDLNARALARNFTLEEVDRLVQAAHKRGKRLFVALNSLVKEREIPALVDSLSVLDALGVDALIIQDLGLWRIARTHFPALRLHASTLMGIHNSAGVTEAHRMGFARVVLAREMTLGEIKASVDAAPVEIEVFVHGALCFSCSGLCRFSSYFGGKSSTRGRCVQPCRRTYDWGGRQGKFFSMRDLSGIGAVDALARIGVRSLKIEGRLRPAHYVASVVKAYRMVLDAPSGDSEAVSGAQRLLVQALGRESTQGYFRNPHPRDALSPDRAASTGRFVGRVVEARNGVLVVSGRSMPEPGDRLRLVLPGSDRQIPFTCTSSSESAKAGTYDVGGLERPEGSGLPGALLFASDLARSPVLAPSGSRPVPERTRPGLFREARSRAAKVLKQLLPKSGGEGAERTPAAHRRAGVGWKVLLRLDDPKRFPKLRPAGLSGIILPIHPKALRVLRAAPSWMKDLDIVWSLPPVIPETSLPFYRRMIQLLARQGFSRFQAGNPGHLALLAGIRGKRTFIFGDYSLNLLNSQAIAAARDLGLQVPMFSLEADQGDLRDAVAKSGNMPVSLTVFAYPPLFTARMDHPAFRTKIRVVSPRGEAFRWEREGGVGFLFPVRPFSLTSRLPELRDLGFSTAVLDLSHWPGDARPPEGHMEMGNEGELARRFPGREFNYSGRLE